jgi:large subunit ribosomal protein L4
MTEEKEKTNLPAKIFNVKVKPAILAQAVRMYLSNQRSAKAKTKTRANVAKTTAKMYKQKGTGRARHGAYSAPIFVGGGVAQGPTGTQNYKLAMPKKTLRIALLGALSEKAKAKEVVILETSEKSKTHDAAKLAKTYKMDGQKVLIITGEKEKDVSRAWKNLDMVTVTGSNSLNPYTVLVNQKIGITKTALKEMEKLFIK